MLLLTSSPVCVMVRKCGCQRRDSGGVCMNSVLQEAVKAAVRWLIDRIVWTSLILIGSLSHPEVFVLITIHENMTLFHRLQLSQQRFSLISESWHDQVLLCSLNLAEVEVLSAFGMTAHIHMTCMLDLINKCSRVSGHNLAYISERVCVCGELGKPQV